MKNNNNKLLTLQIHKKKNIIYNTVILKKLLLNKKYVFFFNLNSLTSQKIIQLKQHIKENNFSSILLSKQKNSLVLPGRTFQPLNTILNQNVIVIYPKPFIKLNKKFLDQLIHKQNITLLLLKWNKKFYRPSQCFNWLKKKGNIHLFLYNQLKQPFYILFLILKYFKTKLI